MKKFFCRSVFVVALLPVLGGCVEDKYDLSDIDTTVGVTVDQLVIPINLDEITLGNIITVDDDSELQIVDGKYMIVREGDFDSDAINVPAIHLSAPSISSTETTIVPVGGVPGTLALAEAPVALTYNLASSGSTFTYHSSSVSDFIVRIDHLGCKLSLDIDLTVKGLEDFANSTTFSDVVIQLPKGLDMTSTEGGTYSSATGELRLPSRTVSGNMLKLHFEAGGIDFAATDGRYDYEGSEVMVSGSLYIKEGKATISLNNLSAGAIASIPPQLTLRTDYRISDADITSFSGEIRYKIDGSKLTDIDLNSLPDLLSQHATDLTFVNPMIYLSISNPLQPYGLFARTGIEIDAYHGEQLTPYALDNPWFQIGPENPAGVYNFCLSPTAPSKPEVGYTPCTHVGFAALRNVLSGDGIPERLEINLTDPNVPVQQVKNLPLGTTLGRLHGSYRFIAPLQFGAGSRIIYDHVMDGWASDDLNDLVIYTLEVEMDVSTDIPVGVKFAGYPIDSSGNRMTNVAIVGANIDAMASNQHVTIAITGEIRHLGGIAFEATATATDGNALSPSMSVKLKNIRPRVSGFYERKL